MTTPKDNGRPAFPNNDQHGCAFNGMTLRDWFAGMALQGICSSPELLERYWNRGGVIKASKECYILADAMLTVRKEGA